MHGGQLIKKIISYFLCMLFGALFGVLFGVCWLAEKCEQELIDKKERAKKNSVSMKSACKWINAIQSGRHIENYFEDKDINSVAIYGIGEIGTLLIKELEKKGIEISFVIDKSKCIETCDYKLFSPDDDLPQTDAVIVTPVYYFTDIEDKLRKHTDARIISIDDIWG